jgi:hypothetical protein
LKIDFDKSGAFEKKIANASALASMFSEVMIASPKKARC